MHLIKHLLDDSTNIQTIEGGWTNILVRLLAAKAPEGQIVAMKTAYLCGAAVTMNLLNKEIVKGQKTEEEAGEYIEGIRLGLTEFANKMDRKLS